MRISEISLNDAVEYCRIDEPDKNDELEIENFMQSAKSYIKNYTGLNDNELDDFEDLSIAYLMIIADFYDNRNLYADYKATTLNKGIETILNLHCRNFV